MSIQNGRLDDLYIKRSSEFGFDSEEIGAYLRFVDFLSKFDDEAKKQVNTVFVEVQSSKLLTHCSCSGLL